jgi:branched-chain amino acid transport system permease protein
VSTAAPSPQLRAAVRRMWTRRALALTALAFTFVLPYVPIVGTYIRQHALVFGWALTSAIVGLSMNVLVGYAGQISLAQAVFYGTGAFTVGFLVAVHKVPWLVGLPLAGVVSALVALVIGFPALRIRGLQLAIATLGFQFAMQRVFFRIKGLTGGAAGFTIRRPEFSKTSHFFEDDTHFMWIIIAVMIFVWLVDRNLSRSRAGRAFFAIRQDEQVASSFGIPVSQYKLLAFAIAGFYAGLAGALYGTLVSDVTNELFDFTFSLEFLVFAVLGGLGSRGGTAFGSALPVLFRQLLDKLRFAGTQIGGMLLVLTLLRFPGGIAAQARETGHAARELTRRKWWYALVLFGAAVVSVFVSLEIGMRSTAVTRRAFELINAPDEGYVVSFLLGLAINAVLFEGTVRYLFKISGGLTHEQHEIADVAIPTPLLQNGSIPQMQFRRPEIARAARGALLEVDAVTKQFGGVRALNAISLEVREGELVGIMGPNGSGKTTMLNCISGFLTPNGGDIRFRGESVLKKAPHARAALGIGRTFQNIGLVKQETVFDNFVIAQHLVCRYGAMEGLARTGAVIREERRLRARANAAIELLGLGDIVNEKVQSLPHGRAKLVELGCALVTGPEILLLDEPAAGVSPQEADALGETLKKISADFGVTILMIEHHVPLMLSTCDYIYALDFGQMLTHGEPAEVAAHPDVIAAYLGSVGKEASLAVTGGH